MLKSSRSQLRACARGQLREEIFSKNFLSAVHSDGDLDLRWRSNPLEESRRTTASSGRTQVRQYHNACKPNRHQGVSSPLKAGLVRGSGNTRPTHKGEINVDHLSFDGNRTPLTRSPSLFFRRTMPYTADWRRKKIAEGLCGCCGQQPLYNKGECNDCAKKRSDRQKKKYTEEAIKISQKRQEKIKEGICPRCGKQPPNEHMKHCNDCLEIQRQYALSVKEKAYNGYGGYKCNCCGETTPEFLNLDHVHDDGAEHRRQAGNRGSGTGLYLWAIKNGFPPILQVLCANCNLGKRLNKGVCPHKSRAPHE